MRGNRAVLLVLAFAATGCDRHATHDECVGMIDKYLDMVTWRDDEVARADERERKAVLETKKAQKKADESYKKALSQCEAEVKKHELDCAMRAETPEGWQACID
jgi:hypothetical protein